MSRVAHWNSVYATKQPEGLSWFQPHLDLSLQLLERAGLRHSTRIIDIGAGASTLVDDLLARDVQAVTALDISAAALRITRDRLRERADRVRWIVSDVTELNLPPSSIDIWHDRATLHFLTDPRDAHAYVQVASRVVTPGGHAVIAGFASDGPEQCSLLPVVRRDPEQVAELFAKEFVLVEARRESHTTPGGSLQRFAYALLRKRAD
ncbi:MAG TPA: class I SAM-dependent methyltransferase [Steroidobacteraceae bacterium]|jgi:ubiquinone/menaquinone biosynthesis C-methylase UbiE|nr:class I SAM-dependent methyltransferase [Steroidobacteraceae bacterium]